ncbi:MAG: hypothetical protein FWF15_01265 [Oscillospiraceae bacterium]|nr:hypothetical protein [Oscillospiraceae bacterium]
MADKNKKFKLIFIILAVIIGLLIILFIINLILQNVSESISKINNSPETQKRYYYFYESDYDLNILEDEEYLDKNRYIEYTQGAVSILITDGNFNEYGRPIEFFNEYFTAVINGDAEKYNTFFSEDYHSDSNNKKYEKFTMQRIYNINVTLLSETVIEEGKYYGYNRYVFKVSYMIMKNDGSFRDDMGSDGSIPLNFEILDDKNKIFINSISKYIYIYE